MYGGNWGGIGKGEGGYCVPSVGMSWVGTVSLEVLFCGSINSNLVNYETI